MARTKFTFEKRQRELARQQKQKDKAARRAEAKQSKDRPLPAVPEDGSDADDRFADPPAPAENQ